MPWLEARLKESFPDPSAFLSEKEFTYAAMATSSFKKVVAELIGWVAQQKDIRKHLEDKREGKVIDKFAIGR